MLSALLNTSYVFMIRQSFRYAGAWRATYLKALGMLTASQLVWVLRPLVLAGVIDTLQAGGPEVLSRVGAWLGLYALVECLPWVVWKPARQMERSAAFQMRRALIDRFYGMLQGLPIAWHRDHHSGDTINRVRKAADCLFEFSQNQFMYIMMITQVVMSFTIIVFLSPLIGGIALLCTVLTGLAVARFDRILVPLYSRENEGEHKVAATLFDYISNITTIISLRLGRRTQANLLEKIDLIWPVFCRQIRIHENKYMVLTVCIVLLDVSIIGAYIWTQIVTTGTVAIGTTVAIYQYLRLLSDTFYTFADNYQQVIRWKTDFAAVGDIERAAAQGVLPSETEQVEWNAWQNLHIAGLDFSYRPSGQEDCGEEAVANLHGIEFSCSRGEKIAVVGASGAGKSTLLALLRGLYIPDRADVHVDGERLATLAPLWNQTTLVPQDPEIFENTILYNITVGLDVPEAEVRQAVELAGFSDVVLRLPQGLNSDIREKGVNLSGGEKQRLALARGILAARSSTILLLDEPTSSVDLLTEGMIYRRMFAHFTQTTIISSLHRLHLLPLFDRVLVLEEGRLAENGSFADLLARGGLLSRLWQDYQNQQKSEAA